MQHDLSNLLRGRRAAEREAIQDRFRFTLAGPDLPEFDPVQINRAVRRFPADVVVLDPLGDFMPSLENENDAVGMRMVVRSIIRAIQTASPRAAIVFVHHARSGSAAAKGAVGWDAQAYARGSKALMSMARAQVNFAPGDEEGLSVLVGCGKCNNGPKFRPFGVERDQDGVFQAIPNFDIETWKSRIGGRKGGRQKSVTAADVVSVLTHEPGPGLSFGNLVKELIRVMDCAERTAAWAITGARAEGLVNMLNGVYCLPKEEGQ
jgi:hypothetical protein